MYAVITKGDEDFFSTFVSINNIGGGGKGN